MFCKKCGKLVKDNAKFCGYCGAKMTEPEPAPAEAAPLEGTAADFPPSEAAAAAVAGMSSQAETPEEDATTRLSHKEPEEDATTRLSHEEHEAPAESLSEEMPEEVPAEPLSEEMPEEAPAESLSAEMPEGERAEGLSSQAAEGGEQAPPYGEQAPPYGEQASPYGEQAGASRRMTFCKECGAPIEEGLPFCRICGAETQWCGNYASQPPVSDTPEVPPARKVIAEHRAINVIMSVLLSILLFAFALSSFAFALVKPALNKVDFGEMLSDTDLTEIEVPVDGEKTNLADYIYDLCDENAPDLHLTKEAVEQVLNEDFIKDFAGDVIDEYRAYLFGDETAEGLTKDRALDFVRKNEKKILRILEDNGVKDAEIDYDELEEQLDKNFASLDLESDMGSGIFGAVSTVVNRVLPAVAIALAALAGLFLLLLIVLNASHVTAMLNHIGIPVGLVGFIGLAGGIILRILRKKMEASDPLALAATGLIDSAKLQLLSGGVILLAVGILMFVAVIVKHCVLKKRGQPN